MLTTIGFLDFNTISSQGEKSADQLNLDAFNAIADAESKMER